MANEKKSKKSIDPSKLTPEYIAEQRRLREARKEQKRQDLIKRGIDPQQSQIPQHLKFIERPLLQVKQAQNGPKIKIMTYNILAQALIRRKLFPTSGNALKWNSRSTVLMNEFKHYNADIMCLQEVDFIQFNSFWKSEFAKLSYDCKYYRSGSKNHGLAIVYRSNMFECLHLSHIQYDKEVTGDLKPSCATQNVGLLACLEFTSTFRKQYPNITNSGFIIGTTHLFWHPFGTYERTRQAYIVLQKCKDFTQTLNTLYPNKCWYSFFAGDFNSQPFDSPYLSITSKPVKYQNRAPLVLGCSLSYQYSANRGVLNDEGEIEEGTAEDEEGGNVEKFGKDQPRDPVPESFQHTPEQLETISKLEALHNSLDMKAISLYSVGYSEVHPENSGIDNDRGEPFFSNWAHSWRGLLDYIFLVAPWESQTEDHSRQPQSLRELEEKHHIRLVSLLRLPTKEEMGPEPSGQPRLGQYPSDHLALMAEVELM